MKNFTNFGVKRRSFPEYNYNALWSNLKTIRTGKGVAKELPADRAEFYDVSLGNKCVTGKCQFCYVSSNPNGEYYEDVCQTWKKWMDTFPKDIIKHNVTLTEKPFQIAIGSEGESTETPNICEILETVYTTGVVPNYTSNGVILSYYDKPNTEYYELANKILDYTRRFVGGVAISFGN